MMLINISPTKSDNTSMKVYRIIFLIIFFSFNTVKCVENIEETSKLVNVFSKITNFYTKSSVSIKNVECRQQIVQYIQALTSEPKMWAYKMFDASSKMQAGILSGNINELGAFDQCLSIDNVANNITIKGKHCYATLSINETIFGKEKQIVFARKKNAGGQTRDTDNFFIDLKWSICIPDACSGEQIQNFIQSHLFNKNSNFKIIITESDCQTAESIKPKLTPADWGFVGFLIVILVLIISSTLYDICLQRTETNPLHPILLAFSVLTNGKRLIAINKSPEQLPCLHGLRWFSMMWVILGHRYTTDIEEPLVNSADVFEWVKNILSMLQLGSTVSVDTFFMLSGCLLMYGFLKSMSKKVPFNIALFYLHRYLRLTPALAVVIVFHLTIMQYMGSGPNWPSKVKFLREGCKTDWWKVLLYVQNYVPRGYESYDCIGQGWYLAIDMQLYWISPLILLPIWYFKRIVWPYLSTLIVIFIAVPMYIAYVHELPPLGFDTENQAAVDDILYLKTHARAATWLVGLCLGYVLFYTRGKKININLFWSTVLWMLSTFVALYVVFGAYSSMQEGYEYQKWFSIIFVGLHRVAWCISLSWVVFACVHGYGAPVNWILSLPMFQVLGRLTYSMYLVHMTVQFMRVGVIRSPGHFSNLDEWYAFWGDLVFSLMVAIVWVLAFESPVGIIDNVLFGKVKSPRIETVKSSP